MAYFLNHPDVKYKEDYEKTGHTYTFSGPCMKCKKEQTVTVQGPDLYKYNKGGYMQNCFPYLNPGQREWMISGICGDCYDKMFPEE